MLMSEFIMLHSNDQILGPGLTKSTRGIIHGLFVGLGSVLAISGILIKIITRNTDRNPHFTSAHGIAGKDLDKF